MHRGIPRASSHLGARGVFCGRLPSCKAKNFPGNIHTPAQLWSSRTRSSPPGYCAQDCAHEGPKRPNESRSSLAGNYAEVLGTKGTRWGFNGAFQTAAPLVQVDPQEKVGE
jgi:hypothetical protein